MTSLRRLRSEGEKRYGIEDFAQWVKMADASFPIGGMQTLSPFGAGDQRQIFPEATIAEFQNIYRTNGIVFACSMVRQRIFSEVNFRFAAIQGGRIGKLFGTSDLSLLENPWPNGTTGELASLMIHDVDTAGNFYAVRNGDRLYWRNPRKMSIILNGDPLQDEYVDIVGYAYRPQGGGAGPLYTYTPDKVCHWSPIPDPENPWKGMSWISPILREVTSDNSATEHKAQFFKNGATPNMVVKFPPEVMTQTQFDIFKKKMQDEYAGTRGAGKTLYLAPGADVEVVGKDFKEMDFSETQGRDETRIASAAGVPAVILGLKESLAGSSLTTGNYSAARRNFADGTMRPLYRSAAAALETLVPAPQAKGPAKLWYDDTEVAFFREDQADAADIGAKQAEMIRTYIIAGWEPDSVIAMVEADDRSLLKHSGLYSIQLQEPGALNPKLNEPAIDAPPIDPNAATVPQTVPQTGASS